MAQASASAGAPAPAGVPTAEADEVISDAQLEQLEDIMSETVSDAIERYAKQGLATLVRHLAKRLEHEAERLRRDAGAVAAGAARA